MNFTGRFDNLIVDLADNKQKAIFALNEDAKQAFDDLKGCKISIHAPARGATRKITS